MRDPSTGPLSFLGTSLGSAKTTPGTPAGFAGAYRTLAMEPLAVVVMYGRDRVFSAYLRASQVSERESVGKRVGWAAKR